MLIPAHGRDYRTPVEIRHDFEMGRDFVIADMSHPSDGKPVNRAQMSVGDSVRVRYSHLTKIAMFIVLNPGEWKLGDALTRTQRAALTSDRAAGYGVDGAIGSSLKRLGLAGPEGRLTTPGFVVRDELLNHIVTRLEGES